MKKVLFLGALALGAAACEPEIAQDTTADTSADVVVAEFDPSASPAVVPSPNDLAINSATGLVNAPVDRSAPAASQEFTRDYINTLNGFPVTAIASTRIKNLDPSSVSTATVKFIDLYKDTPLQKPAAVPTIAYNPDTSTINIFPPLPQGWPKGGRYAVAIIGGENGVKTTDGKPVVASATWAFASSQTPLVTCEDLTAPNCRATTELIPSTVNDPAARIADQTAKALQLEQLRRAYGPLIDLVAETESVKREDVVLLWTFTIMDMPEATFDPANRIIPFPNDLLRAPAQGETPPHLTLPGADAPGQQGDLIRGLNTLDGWSTTAPIISENSPTHGPLETGVTLDPSTVKLGESVHFVKLGTGGTTPKVKVCFNCASSLTATGQVPNAPQQLQIVPEQPLDEATTYAVVLMKDKLKDTRGRLVAPNAAQALIRISAPLVDANGKSQISAVPDNNAAALEPVRAAMKPVFDALAAQGIARKDIALAWVFTTQSTRKVLERLNAAPNAVPADPLYLHEQTNEFKAAMEANRLNNESVGRAFIGAFASPYLLSDTQGVLNRAAPRIDRIPFILMVPPTPAPEGGYPVVVFGHGLTGNRTNILAVANNFNKAGYAVAAIDAVQHGERSSCAGISAQSPVVIGPRDNPTLVIDSPDEACAEGSTCDVTPDSPTFGRCVNSAAAISCNPAPTAAPAGDLVCASQGQGRCLSTGRCEGGDFRRPAANQPPYISGWNFLNLVNLFATRDNFRHHVVDFAQFSRMLGSDGLNTRLAAVPQADGISAGPVNGAKVHYVGQSLGGLLGPLSASVSNRMEKVALNATGGDLVDVLFTASNPTFALYRTGFLNSLNAAGRVQGTPQFDEFITLARTILDPASPRNYGWYLENAPSAPEGREAFIQYVLGDTLITNPVTEGLIDSANRDSERTVASYMVDLANDNIPEHDRHGFFTFYNRNLDPSNPAHAQMLAYLKSVRDAAQGQVIEFLNTGTPNLP